MSLGAVPGDDDAYIYWGGSSACITVKWHHQHQHIGRFYFACIVYHPTKEPLLSIEVMGL
eukprot:scaffold3716_cov69-Cylindrotheca_fusiformis.AAC.28